jgi:small subunit ribosomal protein S6
MPTNVYECMFLLDTTKVAGDVPAVAQQLRAILERNHAEVLASRPWDERRLAYPIKRGGTSHKKGLYFLTYFRTEAKNVVDIERDFALNETILRSLVLKVDPKLEDTMLALARDEHALALQAASAESGEEAVPGGQEDGVEESPRPPRRGRRPAEEEKD